MMVNGFCQEYTKQNKEQKMKIFKNCKKLPEFKKPL